jgi:hypothetical protein
LGSRVSHLDEEKNVFDVMSTLVSCEVIYIVSNFSICCNLTPLQAASSSSLRPLDRLFLPNDYYFLELSVLESIGFDPILFLNASARDVQRVLADQAKLFLEDLWAGLEAAFERAESFLSASELELSCLETFASFARWV